MANTSSRALRLLSLLQTHRYWPGQELAARLEVSPRTLRRDVDRLRALGYPVEATPGVAGGYQLGAGAAMPPLLLDDDEAVALVVGLHAAVHGPVEGIAETSLRALAKVRQVMPPRLRGRVEALSAMTSAAPWSAAAQAIDADLLTRLALACRDTERLRFDYTAADGAATMRHVEPHRLVTIGQRWYLVAYDLDRHGWRSFRADRLAAARRTGEAFTARAIPGGDAAAFVRAGILSAPRGYDVDVTVAAPADAVRARIGRWATVAATDAGHCRVTLSTDALEWPAMALGTLDAPFEVRSPPELRALLRRWATRFAHS